MTEAEAMVILGFVSLAAAGDARALDSIAAFVEDRTERPSDAGKAARQRRWRAKKASTKASTNGVSGRLQDPSTERLHEASTDPSLAGAQSDLNLTPIPLIPNSKSEETDTDQTREETPVVDASVDGRVDASRRRSVDVHRVYTHWVSEMGKNPSTTKLTAQRRSKIEARLRDGYSVDDLCAAVTGCKRSPFHMGENDRGEPYNGLETILRDAKTIESHRDRITAPIAPISTPRHRELPPPPPVTE